MDRFVLFLCFIIAWPLTLWAEYPRETIELISRSLERSELPRAEKVRSMMIDLELNDQRWIELEPLAGEGITWSGLEDRLKKLEFLPDELLPNIQTLQRNDQELLLRLLEELKRLAQLAESGLISVESIYTALQKGGTNALLAFQPLRASDRDLALAVQGFELFGPDFEGILVQPESTKILRELMRHTDELLLLKPASLEKLLRHSARYFDIDGKPLPGFQLLLDEAAESTVPESSLSRTSRLAQLSATIVYACCPDSFFDALETVFPRAFVDALRSLKWVFRYAILFGLIILLFSLAAPIFGPPLRLLWMAVLRLLCSLPGSTGAWAKRNLEELRGEGPVLSNAGLFRAKIGRKREIRIGLLGSRRVGKSTFITMLGTKLGSLIAEADFEPATGDDKKRFDEIKDDVAHGRPSNQMIQVNMKLTWPFNRQGKEFTGGGHLSEKLHLMDYPGEHACAEHHSKEFRDLVEHLNQVDGLFVIIDPTELELQGTNRLQNQLEVINQMFNESGLDLGTHFKRAIGILITKRDAIDRQWLEKRRENLSDAEFEKLVRLAEKRELTLEESKELGRAILDILFPNRLKKLRTKLSPEHGNTAETAGFWLRSLWPPRPQSPHIEVFALSQLGFELGRKVSQARKNGVTAQWSEKLDLDAANPKELDLHYPFQWMFDHIPGGWLNELNTRGGLLNIYHRSIVSRRFRGAPIVKENQTVFWRRFGLVAFAMAMLILLFSRGADERQHKFDRVMARKFLTETIEQGNPAASAARYYDTIRHCRELATKPFSTDLDQFERLIDIRARMENHEKDIQSPRSNPLKKLESMDAWFREYRNFTNHALSEQTELEELDRYCQKERDRMRNMLGDYVNLVKSYTDELFRHDQYRDAIQVARNAGKTVATITLPQNNTAPGDIETILSEAYDRFFEHLFEKHLDRIKPLLKEDRYQEAVRIVDDFITDDSPADEIREKAMAYRKRYMKEYQTYIKSRVEQLCRAGNFEQAASELGQYLRTPEMPEPEQKEAQALLAEIPNRSVLHAVEEAAQKAVQGDREDAWKILQAVSANYQLCSDSVRKRWIEEAVKCKQSLQLYGDAVAILNEHPDAQRKAELSDTIWNNWAESLKYNVPRLISQGKFDLARTRFERFDELKRTCPAQVQTQIEQFKKEQLPTIDVAEAVRFSRTTGPEEKENALSRLLALKTELIDHVQDSRQAREWLDAVNNTYTALERTNEAIAFLETVRDDPVLRERTGFSESMIREHQLGSYEAVLQIAQKEADEGNTLQAVQILRRARELVVKLDSKENQLQWLRKIGDFYGQMNANLEGLRFLLEIQNDPRLQDIVRDEMIQHKRESHIAQIRKEFETTKAGQLNALAWQNLLKQRDKDMDPQTREAFDQLVLALVEIQMAQLDTELQQLLTGEPDYPAATAQLEQIRSDMNIWTNITDYGIDRQLRQREEDLAAKFLNNRISALVTTGEFEKNHAEINSILNEKIEESVRQHLETLKSRILRHWENDAYEQVAQSLKDGRFEELLQHAKYYLDIGKPFAQNRSPQRTESVERLKEWLERFDRPREYKLIALRYDQFPKATWGATWNAFSNYDPAVRIEIENRRITGEKKNLAGSGTWTGLSVPDTFKWKKGDPITLTLWQGSVDHKGYCIGRIIETDPYALLWLALPDQFLPLDLSKGDYKKNPDFTKSGLRLGLTIEGIPPLPEMNE